MIVYFIRHGETDFNKRCLIQGMSDIPLNDKGIQQAGIAAEWFEKQNITFDRVFASPLVRARKTAAIVSGRTFEEVQPCNVSSSWISWRTIASKHGAP